MIRKNDRDEANNYDLFHPLLGVASFATSSAVIYLIFLILAIIYAVNNLNNPLMFIGLITIVGGILVTVSIIIGIKINTKQNNDTLISENYFNQINEIIENLLNIHNNLKNDFNFRVFLNKEPDRFFWLLKNGQKIVHIEERIRLLFLMDIIKCYRLENQIDLRSKKGIGFF